MTVLSPGLPPDEVERLRWHVFGQKRALALRSAEDLVRFTEQRGFVLFGPLSGVHYPSALEAAVGRPLLENVRDERTTVVERWCADCTAAGKLVRAPVVEGRDTLLALEYAADIVACGGAAAVALKASPVRGAAPRDPDAARARVADRVLRNVLVATSEELAHLLAWPEPVAHAALTALVERGDALVHPATRPRRATFQACACELLEPA